MRRFFAMVLYLCFGLPLALAALFMLASRPWILDREFYRKLVTDESLYAALRAPGLATGAEPELKLGELTLNGPALVAAAQKNLLGSELKAFASLSVDAVLDAVEGKAGSAPAIDMGAAKRALEARQEALARDYTAALPVRAGTPAQGDLSFRPDSVKPERAAELASRALKASIAKIPDRVPLALPSTREGSAPRALSQAMVNRGIALLSALSVILLSLLAWLGGKDAGRRIVCAGRYLLIPSLAVLALGIVLFLPGASILQGLSPPAVHVSMTGSGGGALRSWMARVLGQVSRGFMATGLIGASIAGALISLRRVFNPKEV